MFAHSQNLVTAQEAARAAGLPSDRIIVLDSPPSLQSHLNIDQCIQEGLTQPPLFTERRLNPGEAKTKLALLSFSSGTTGQPKAVAIPHYALIANLVQMSFHGKINEDYTPEEDRRYKPGDVIYAGRWSFYACSSITANFRHSAAFLSYVDVRSELVPLITFA